MAPRAGHVTVAQGIVVKGGHRCPGGFRERRRGDSVRPVGAMLAESNEGGKCAESGDGK
jgi:hypothetical protein